MEAGAARTWGFQTLLVASGASELESSAKSELLKLLSSESLLASWTRRCSFRVVNRSDVEALARKTKSEELETAAAAEAATKEHVQDNDNDEQEQLEGGDQPSPAPVASLAESSSHKSIGASSSNTQIQSNPSLAQLDSFELAPQILASAFQRLVREDKTAFLAHMVAASSLATAAASPEADETTTPAVSSDPSSSPLAEFLANNQQSQASATAPARIYFLVEYPSSLDEMQALLRTGEAGSSPALYQGGLPLLPLIDGALLVVDPTKDLRERRKSVSLSGERCKSISQKHIVANAISSAVNDSLGSANAVPSVFQIANVLVSQYYEASSVGGLEWSDFVFADLSCSSAVKEPKGLADLAKELLVNAEALAAQKYEFKHWVSTTKMIQIPAYDPNSQDAARALDVYEQTLNLVYEASVGVSTVLFAMKEAIVLIAEKTENGGGGCDTSDFGNNQSYVEEFITYNDSAALRLAVAYTTFIKEHEAIEENNKKGGDPYSILGKKIDEVKKEMWRFSDLPGVGNSGRKGMPIKSQLTSTERSVQDTEFALCCKFDVSQAHLTRQMLRFEMLLGPVWKGKLQQTRCFVEELDRDILPQRLAQILGNFPTVYKHYDPATDSLLVATLVATAPGRFRTTAWSAKDHVHHRPAFKDWRKEQLVPDEYLTPRTTKALGTCMPLSSAELSLMSEKTSVLFPSDQSVIRLYQTPRGYTWLNVYQGGDVFGFRQIDKQKHQLTGSGGPSSHMLQFCASFEDNSQLHIFEGRLLRKKPDGFPTITASNTFPNGLTVTACSDGTIVQQYVSAHQQQQPHCSGERREDDGEKEREIYRLVVGKGAVLREFASGERVVLLANGDVHHMGQTAAAGGDNDEDLDSKPLRMVDPAANALVEKRPNGVVVVIHTDGSRVTHHTDGTRMFTNSSKSHVLVKKVGFADVCIDIQVNLTAQRHARGERVAVTKGGLRTRSIIDVYDGTRIEVSYNTKVIAQVNGRVTTRKPDGICVVAKDSGRIEYQSPRSAAFATGSTRQASNEDDDLDITSHNGVYYFDCARGRFELCDHEQNQFAIDFVDSNSNSVSSSNNSTGATLRVSTDLAGVVSDTDAAKYEVNPIPAKAVVNDPIEPHLLILNGDGTGREVLRPRDIEQYLRQQDTASRKQEVYSGFQNSYGQEQAQAQHRVFFEELQCSSVKGSTILFNDPKLHAEFEKLLQKPVNAAAKYLEGHHHSYINCVQLPHPQFTIVRKIQQIQPLNGSELLEMHAAIEQWRALQEAREANKDQYTVVDPRDDNTIAQQAAVQKKVVAAYKATRSRKKLEKQKAREMKKKLLLQSPGGRLSVGGAADGQMGNVVHMETVQETHLDEKDDEDKGDSDGGGDFGFSSGDSANGDDLDDEVDDPVELLWTAFADADATNSGRLAIGQTRQALVHVLGVGVPTWELMTVLKGFKLQDPSQVSFDTFSELVVVYRNKNDEGEQQESNNNNNNSASSPSTPQNSVAVARLLPTLEGIKSAAFVAAGSATEAIRLKQKSSN